MKFGILRNDERNLINIGDHIMGLSTEKIYDAMGVDKSLRTDILITEASAYSGEYVILPINMYLDSVGNGCMFPLSPRIIPVFLGFHMLSELGSLKYLGQYRNFGPFGCRDEFTMNALRRNGLEAYVTGCFSILSVDKKKMNQNKKVFFVDTPKELDEFIPDRIKIGSCILSDVFDYSDKNLTFRQAQEIGTSLARNRIRLYEEEAGLVVTSRMHCALPCISMGIPVIFVRHSIPQRYLSAFDGRFSGIDKYMTMYTKEDFSNINWNPPIPDISELKEAQMKLAIEMITRAYDKYKNICDISSYYETRERQIYFSGVNFSYLGETQKEKFLVEKRSKQLLSLIFGENLGDVHVVIWGAGDKGKWMYARFRDSLKMCKSLVYVDSDKNKHGKAINGVKIISPRNLLKYKDKKRTKVIIAMDKSYNSTAQDIAKYLHDKLYFDEGRNYFMLDKLILSAKYVLDDFGEINNYAQDAIWY